MPVVKVRKGLVDVRLDVVPHRKVTFGNGRSGALAVKALGYYSEGYF